MDRITLKKRFSIMEPGEPGNRVYEPGEYEVAEKPRADQISPAGARIAVEEKRIAAPVKTKKKPAAAPASASAPAAAEASAGKNASAGEKDDGKKAS